MVAAMNGRPSVVLPKLVDADAVARVLREQLEVRDDFVPVEQLPVCAHRVAEVRFRRRDGARMQRDSSMTTGKRRERFMRAINSCQSARYQRRNRSGSLLSGSFAKRVSFVS